MKKKRFSEERIIRVLKEGEAGAKTPELCRKHGISEATFYNWKGKYGGMTVSDARRLEELEAELDKASLKARPVRARGAARRANELAVKEGIPFREAYRRVAADIARDEGDRPSLRPT